MKCRVLESGNCEITQGYNSNHHANDIVGGGYTLDNVVAHTEGKVIILQDGYGNMKGSTGNASYGNFVKLEHKNGYATLYAHMQKGLLVKNGEFVKKGQRLGYMSDSGNANGGHLHFEVWKDGVRINPTEYLDKDLFTEIIEKSVEELAREVIEGKYGNGQERKDRLGDRYSEVQARVNEILAPKVTYLSNPSYNGVSIVDALNQIGVDSSYGYRARLAEVNEISNYIGTAEQNTYMLNLLKKGTLKSA